MRITIDQPELQAAADNLPDPRPYTLSMIAVHGYGSLAAPARVRLESSLPVEFSYLETMQTKAPPDGVEYKSLYDSYQSLSSHLEGIMRSSGARYDPLTRLQFAHQMLDDIFSAESGQDGGQIHPDLPAYRPCDPYRP